jgi:hypothetical protein
MAEIDTSAEAVARRAAMQYCAELGLDPHENVYEQRGISYAYGQRLGFLEAKFQRLIAERRAVDAIVAAERDRLAEENARLRDALKFGVDLIEGDSFGSEWKRGCADFRRMARAELGKS